jgi:hypothetical protein
VRLTTSLQVGAKYFGCVVCRFHVAADAGSAPCQKPASINLQKWFLSPTGRLNLGFTIEENLPLFSSHLPLGVPNWAVSTANTPLVSWRAKGIETLKRIFPRAQYAKISYPGSHPSQCPPLPHKAPAKPGHCCDLSSNRKGSAIPPLSTLEQSKCRSLSFLEIVMGISL